jgi:hypothetical protein
MKSTILDASRAALELADPLKFRVFEGALPSTDLPWWLLAVSVISLLGRKLKTVGGCAPTRHLGVWDQVTSKCEVGHHGHVLVFEGVAVQDVAAAVAGAGAGAGAGEADEHFDHFDHFVGADIHGVLPAGIRWVRGLPPLRRCT